MRQTSAERPGRITGEVVDLTSEMAVDLLLQNHCNRPLRRDRVQALARDIRANKWRYTGDPIKIATITSEDEVYTETGDRVPAGAEVVIDGQHRLHGLLLAAKHNPNVEIRVRIERGFTYQTQRVIDAGTPRNAADLLHFEHPLLAVNSRLTVALARRIYRFQISGNLLDRHHLPTNDELLDLVNSNLDRFVEAATYAEKHASPRMPASLVAWFYYTLTGVDAELGRWFMLKFHVGADLPEGHPILLLRDKLDKEIDKSRRHLRRRIGEAEIAMYTIIAWNHIYLARRRGRPDPTFQKLQASRGGISSASFKIAGLPSVRTSDA